MGWSVKKKCIGSFTEIIFVVLEHNLSVAIWVRQRYHIQTMHLFQELAHVGACDGREQDKLQVDPLNFCLSKVKLML